MRENFVSVDDCLERSGARFVCSGLPSNRRGSADFQAEWSGGHAKTERGRCVWFSETGTRLLAVPRLFQVAVDMRCFSDVALPRSGRVYPVCVQENMIEPTNLPSDTH